MTERRPAHIPHDPAKRLSWNERDAQARIHPQTVLPKDGFIYRIKWPRDNTPRIVTKNQVIGLLSARRAGRYGGRSIDFTIERSPLGEFTECAAEFAHVDGECEKKYCECKEYD